MTSGDRSLFDLSGRVAVVTGGNGESAAPLHWVWLGQVHLWLCSRVTKKRIALCLRNCKASADPQWSLVSMLRIERHLDLP